MAPPHEWPTDLLVPVRDLYDALVVWLGVREPTSAWLTADGKAVATGLVPAFFDGSAEAVSSFGLFEAQSAAVFVRLATAEASRSVSVGIRGYGDRGVAERLREATLAWDRSGRPGLAGLRVRAIPIERAHEPRAGETVLLRMCTRFVLDWPS